MTTSWGATILADPSKAIGRSIATTGLYDLALSETLLRLVEPGDTVVDAGANVGYFTVLAASAAGSAGRVVAFEPHPELFGILRENVDRARRRASLAATDLRQSALSDVPGRATLQVPAAFSSNDGLATLVRSTPHPAPGTLHSAPSTLFEVPVEILDQVLDGAPVSVLKLDVEGAESAVLRGARVSLSAKRIRHVIFEEHQYADSAIVGALQQSGYTVFSLGWSLRGIEIAREPLARPYEAPNFIATLDAQDLLRRCAPRGWSALRPLSQLRFSNQSPF